MYVAVVPPDPVLTFAHPELPLGDSCHWSVIPLTLFVYPLKVTVVEPEQVNAVVAAVAVPPVGVPEQAGAAVILIK